MAYAVIRTDLMSGTKQPADLVSLRFYDASGNKAEVENGVIVKLQGYEDGEREVIVSPNRLSSVEAITERASLTSFLRSAIRKTAITSNFILQTTMTISRKRNRTSQILRPVTIRQMYLMERRCGSDATGRVFRL